MLTSHSVQIVSRSPCCLLFYSTLTFCARSSLYVDIHFGTGVVCLVMSALAMLSGAFWHVCICLIVFRCVYYMSSCVHAKAIFLSFPSRRYSRLSSPVG